MMQKTSPLDLSFSSRRISVTIEVAALANFANSLRQQLRLLYLSIIFTLGATGMFALSRQPKRIYQVTYGKSCGRNESSDNCNHIVFDVYRKNSLKAATRDKRGRGVRQRVAGSKWLEPILAWVWKQRWAKQVSCRNHHSSHICKWKTNFHYSSGACPQQYHFFPDANLLFWIWKIQNEICLSVCQAFFCCF